MPQVRIVSDGTPAGTHVYDCDGKEIVGHSKVTWDIRSRGTARAWLEFEAPQIEAAGKLQEKGTPT
jgi:hypothetical protein